MYSYTAQNLMTDSYPFVKLDIFLLGLLVPWCLTINNVVIHAYISVVTATDLSSIFNVLRQISSVCLLFF